MFPCLIASCNDVKEPTKGGTNIPSQSTEIVITPIAQLNQSEIVLNSHKDEWERSSLKMDYRSYISLGTANQVTEPTYPRIRTLKDGSYILTWQDRADGAGNGKNTYYALSKDLKTWEYMGYLWKYEEVTNAAGNADKRVYTNANPFQLANGDIIVVACYRTAKTYGQSRVNSEYRKEQGVVIKRSSDGGKTWTPSGSGKGKDKEIYHGPCWEAHLIEVDNKLQFYFSESRPDISSSHSGTVMIESTDGGNTWLPELGKDAYRVMRKKWWNAVKNIWCFTYQMPVGVILNGTNQYAFAMESCNQSTSSGNQFSIAIVHSKPDEAKTGWEVFKTDNDITPRAQRIDSLVSRGAGPYLIQFPSGETLLSYGGTDSRQHMMMGNASATEFGDIFDGLKVQGSWSGLDLESSHSALSCSRDVSSGSENLIIARYYLNHSIKATQRTVQLDGKNSEWRESDDALFVGSKSQAQATLRASADESYYYFLVEVLDESLSDNDFGYLLLSQESDNTKLGAKSRRIRFGYKGIKNTDQYAGGWKSLDFGARASAAYQGTTGDNKDNDKGFIIEIAVPRSAIAADNGKILVNFGYFDAASNVEDSLADASTTAGWIPVFIN